MRGLLNGYSQYLVMIGEVFHPAELLPVEMIHNESYGSSANMTRITISAQKNSVVCSTSPSKSFISSFWKTSSFHLITGFFVVP